MKSITATDKRTCTNSWNHSYHMQQDANHKEQDWKGEEEQADMKLLLTRERSLQNSRLAVSLWFSTHQNEAHQSRSYMKLGLAIWELWRSIHSYKNHVVWWNSPNWRPCNNKLTPRLTQTGMMHFPVANDHSALGKCRTPVPEERNRYHSEV